MGVRQLNEVSALTGTVVSSESFITCLQIMTTTAQCVCRYYYSSRQQEYIIFTS